MVQALTRALRLGIACLTLVLALPAQSNAAFEPLPLPPGTPTDSGGSGIREFAVSGDAWLAIVNGSGGFPALISHDAGATWTAVGLTGEPYQGLSVAPDGAFWIPMVGSPALDRVTPAGAVTGVALPGMRNISPPAFDSQGRMWFTYTTGSPGTQGLARLAADGTVAEQHPVGALRNPFVTFLDGQPLVRPSIDSFEALSGANLVPALPWAQDYPNDELDPGVAIGKAVVYHHAISFDGGHTASGPPVTYLSPVYGSTAALMRWPLADQADPVMLRRCSSWLFCESSVTIPHGTAALWQTRAGIVAVSADSLTFHGEASSSGSDTVLAIQRGPLAPLAPAKGTLPRGGAALMAQVNRYRKEAGLPPVVDDPLISQAALNHARYLTLNGSRAGKGLALHTEKRGLRGFTGTAPGKRCTVLGTFCDREEIIEGPNPVFAMMGTYYHRVQATFPVMAIGGVARVGRFTVFEFDSQRDGVGLHPFGFPSGRYSGPLAFKGPEIPHPLDSCGPALISGHPHPSTPVSFQPPTTDIDRKATFEPFVSTSETPIVLSVDVFQGRRRLPGCDSISAFIGRAPLRPHTAYTARARWKPSEHAPVQTYAWKFRTR